MCINTSPAPERKGVFKYFAGSFGAVEVYLNTSPAPEKYFCIYLSDTSPAPEKPGKNLKTPFMCRRSIHTHFSGAGKVLLYTYLAPERPKKSEKPEKYLYTLLSIPLYLSLCLSCLTFLLVLKRTESAAV